MIILRAGKEYELSEDELKTAWFEYITEKLRDLTIMRLIDLATDKAATVNVDEGTYPVEVIRDILESDEEIDDAVIAAVDFYDNHMIRTEAVDKAIDYGICSRCETLYYGTP